MTIRRIRPNARMSAAVVHGDTVYVAGQVDRAGATVAAQTAAILAKIDGLLAEAGTDKSTILSANVWLADIGTFDEMNRVWDAWVPAGDAPARATVGAQLADPACKVEIAVVAARVSQP